MNTLLNDQLEGRWFDSAGNAYIFVYLFIKKVGRGKIFAWSKIAHILFLHFLLYFWDRREKNAKKKEKIAEMGKKNYRNISIIIESFSAHISS